MRKNAKAPASTWAPPYDTPLESGERQVSWLRILLAAFGVALTAGYLALPYSHMTMAPLLLTIAASVCWGLMSIVYLLALSRGRYRPWMSYISTAMDIILVTLVQIANMIVLPFNFINGPVTPFYFLVVALAALRKSRWLAFFAGFISAFAHLAVAGAAFYLFIPGGYLMTEIAGQPFEIAFLDHAGIAVLLMACGLIIGHVTHELRVSERHYHDLFEQMPDGVAIVSSDGEIMAVNRRLAQMVGRPAQRIVGRRISDLLERSPLERKPWAPDSGGLPGTHALLLRDDGARTPVRTTSASTEFRGEPCVEMSVRDVADQVQLERQLVQSQKMETLGRLASGLAHDFNNIIGGILGAASLAERGASRLEPGPRRDKLSGQIDVIRACGEKARDVVVKLLTFSRTSRIETEPVDLARLLADVETICRNTFGDTHEVRFDVPETPAVIEGDGTSITQALLNMCINAKDAMPDGGLVTVTLSEASPEEAVATVHSDVDPEESYWAIEVRDTGSGMDAETIGKIFDPFFTTKPPGEGTGLGLSMVYNTARQHGGFVSVESSPGSGSAFRIHLTRARPSVLPDEPAVDLPRGTGEVLVVDDDEVVRSTVCGMLTELGYRVTPAADGREALEELSRDDRTFDLVILDIVMPEMDGVEVLRAIRDRDTDVAVILASGFWSETRAADLDHLGVSGFLVKPFSMLDLARRVASALEPGAAPDDE